MIICSFPTKKEIGVLSRHRKKSKTLLIQDRAHAMLLVAQGYHAPEIGKIIDRDRIVVERWMHVWNEKRIAIFFADSAPSSLQVQKYGRFRQLLRKDWISGTFKPFLLCS